MKAKPQSACIYGPLVDKSLANVLNHWLAEQFPHLCGPKVRDLFVTEVLQLVAAHYTPSQHLQPGQTVWYAVDKTDLPHDGRPMAETRLVPVILTLVTRADIVSLLNGTPLAEVRRTVIHRLHCEADAQGGVLAESDTGLLLWQSPSTISVAIRRYETEHQCIIPRRGTVHDLGRSVSHKAVIVKKALLEAKPASEVAWETAHSVPSTERYLVDLMRVYISMQRCQMTAQETAFATGMSLSLVKEYAALIAELGLTYDRLPGIMADLERQAALRRPESASDATPADQRTAQTTTPLPS